jgi:hypothetical protein
MARGKQHTESKRSEGEQDKYVLHYTLYLARSSLRQRVQVRSGPAQSGPTLYDPAKSGRTQSGPVTIRPLNIWALKQLDGFLKVCPPTLPNPGYV